MSPEFAAEIRHITAQLIEKYAPERIILFGSVARELSSPKTRDLPTPVRDPSNPQ